MRRASTFSKFIQALNVTNAALEAHRESIVFRPLLTACESKLEGEDLGVAIYRDDPEHPQTQLSIRLDDGRFVLVSPDLTVRDLDWIVSEDYLDDVIKRPTRYCNNPNLLQFDWLRRRVGMMS
jgi:hypothetical protein